VLPGGDAHRLLAPRPRRGWQPGRRPEDSRTAAALVLFYPRDGRPYLVLTVRSGILSRHGGQVSFPGGAIEPGEALIAAALREAAEEIGIDPASVRIVGALTPLHIPVSDFTVHPIVAVADEAPAFRLATGEVERVLEVPFEDLTDPARLRLTTRMREDFLVEVPYFDVEGEKVWGATAMMLAELLCVVDARPDIDQAIHDEDPSGPGGPRP
jgi:8-oxo-dGTP pyrophosphatase MutT (NUDIX family)